ncbi:InlB B-repeat-containing protein [Bifidobacterium oedipodis]|uniref:Peptidase family C69 n=1 Tax=Bifidobacterium oedipodis TaxID=2675322 RepID=A0A7Y0HSC5_9BIFI|nr:InlB B-repeat-containing protein [Bifidobacterium sp. DSM 109957]NMM95010.1 peptidase family C69 [Bifidobacterium sp. DSM 109957]
MTGNKNVWRAPLAGLASVAMIATMGVAASTANAAFVPAEKAGKYTVTLDVSKQSGAKLGTALVNKLRQLDANNDFEKKTDDTTDVEVTLNSTDPAKASKATIENVEAKTAVADLIANPAEPANRHFLTWQVGGRAVAGDAKVTGDLDLTGRYYISGNLSTIEFEGAATGTQFQVVKGDKLADWQVGKLADGADAIRGWNTSRAATTALDLSTLDTTKDVKLYPIYGPNRTVTFDLNGGTDGTPATPQTVKVVESTAFEAPKYDDDKAPTNGDLKFVGWNTWADANNDGKVTDNELTSFDFSKGTDKDVTLYAKYAKEAQTAKITFKFPASQKLDGTVVAETDYGYDNVVVNNPVAQPEAPVDNTDQGRSFLYWTESADGSANADNRADKEYAWSANVTADKTLYAVFGEATKKAASKITFDENWQDGAITEVESNEDGTYTVDAPVRQGYTFLGWSDNDTDKDEDKAIDLSDADSVKDYAGGTLYAMWQNPADVDYDQASKVLNENVFTADSFKAYKKVYDKYFDGQGNLKDASKKDEAVKAVLAAQGKLVEKDNVTVYRLYNQYNGGHYYTTDNSEAADLVTLGWTYEGAKFRATGFDNGLNEAVHSAYNKYTGEHLLVRADEAKDLEKIGWTDEGLKFYTLANGSDDLYRLYNPYETGAAAHLYTSDKSEAESLVKLGWKWDFNGEAAFKVN